MKQIAVFLILAVLALVSVPVMAEDGGFLSDYVDGLIEQEAASEGWIDAGVSADQVSASAGRPINAPMTVAVSWGKDTYYVGEPAQITIQQTSGLPLTKGYVYVSVDGQSIMRNSFPVQWTTRPLKWVSQASIRVECRDYYGNRITQEFPAFNVIKKPVRK